MRDLKSDSSHVISKHHLKNSHKNLDLLLTESPLHKKINSFSFANEDFKMKIGQLL